jgi:hypothetical protein
LAAVLKQGKLATLKVLASQPMVFSCCHLSIPLVSPPPPSLSVYLTTPRHYATPLPECIRGRLAHIHNCVSNDLHAAVRQLYAAADRIDVLVWAPSSAYIMSLAAGRGLLQLWSVEDAAWAARIDEGPAGVAHVCVKEDSEGKKEWGQGLGPKCVCVLV